ncbi:MAG: hypothetical protein B7X04_04175 [Parcubacteria group bacterium 21-54-25]|nr:MAG: hypothetical protein B7X04_04175 [Parcubacteria group bacterium 21-54-25]HQU08232.1 hypothetical protein [Candidatus Paceibacterota bacterium]
MPRSKNRTKQKGHTSAIRLSFVVNGVFVGLALSLLLYAASAAGFLPVRYNPTALRNERPAAVVLPPTLNKAQYDKDVLALANSSSTVYKMMPAIASSSVPHWPAKTAYPDAGAVLPFKRIVAYYGNFYSKQMGVLGEYPPEQVLSMLMSEVAKWQAADPSTPVVPAIEYIAVTAQGAPGADGKYRLRMPASQIEKAIQMAGQVHGLVFLDVQVGLSNVQTEIPLLAPYLRLPQVELAIDPEFSMKNGNPPGTVIGTFDASDINYTARYLAQLVDTYHLPPKILVVHRFTDAMVTNYKNITPLPQVEIVMDMDGWGSPARKLRSYHDVIYKDPVQFAGIKLFYKNDIRPPSTHMLTPEEVLKLKPIPIYIQYQ